MGDNMAKPNRVDIAKMLEDHNNGVTQTRIAKNQNVNLRSIQYHFNRLGLTKSRKGGAS